MVNLYVTWGHTIRDGTSCDILSKLKKRAIRRITNSSFRSHTTPLFKTLGILKLQDVFNVFILKFLYNYCNKNLPLYFLTEFSLIKSHDMHSHDTRHNTARLPRAIKSRTQQCMRFYLINAYNEFPECIVGKVLTHSFLGFGNYAKRHFIDIYPDSCNIQDCYICNQKKN